MYSEVGTPTREAPRAMLQVRKHSLFSTPKARQLHPSCLPRNCRWQTAEIRTHINRKFHRVSDLSDKIQSSIQSFNISVNRQPRIAKL